MSIVNVHQPKNHLSRLLAKVEAGAVAAFDVVGNIARQGFRELSAIFGRVMCYWSYPLECAWKL